LILGSGHIGEVIALMLSHTKEYRVTIASKNKKVLQQLQSSNLKTKNLDFGDSRALEEVLKLNDVVLSAAPYWANMRIAKLALKAGVSYFDLTEDTATTAYIKTLAKEAKSGQVFVPQCGLAPGFIGILGYSLSQKFDEIRSLKMRVGALPEYPTNRLMYNLTWSTQGLINEYINPALAITKGVKTELQSLEGLEHFSLDGLKYEAFNTSGGLGTLCETLEGKVQELNYKTVRYPGHRDLMYFLLHTLKMSRDDKRELLKEILEDAIPATTQDVILIMVSVTGMRKGKLEQMTDVRKIYNGVLFDTPLSSIQITTAAGICTVLDLFYEGKLAQQGFIAQEEIDYDAFIANRFGQYYLPKGV
jgi:saccharopine dehydrogenase-like NADP-dependent oxidoreductase